MIPLTKVCAGCKVEKPSDQFSIRTDKPQYLRARCKACYAKQANARYHEGDGAVGQRAIKSNRARRVVNQDYIYEYFQTHPCTDCGESNWIVLEFDHVRGDKTKNVCDMMLMPLQSVMDEIAKCESVCANCHKIRSYTRAKSWRVYYRK